MYPDKCPIWGWQSADPGHNQDINPFAAENIVCNPQFEDGLRCWFGRDCEIELCDSTRNTSILPVYGDVLLLATHRQNNNSGVQQDITEKVKRKIPYDFMATVQISGSPKKAVDADVQAILRIQTVHNLQQEVKIVKLVSLRLYPKSIIALCSVILSIKE